MVPFFGEAVLWHMVPFAIMQLIWKKRNDRIFKGESTLVDDLFVKWAQSN